MNTSRHKYLDFSLFTTVSFWSSLGLSVLILALYVLSRPEIARIPTPGVLEIIEAKTLDARFRLRGPIDPGNEIVIVAVDEKTEDELGRWQSSGRQWIAQLLHILHEGRAKVIGFDLALAEPDEGQALTLIEELRALYADAPHTAEDRPDLNAYLDQAEVTHNHDLQLAQAIQEAGNVVLGMYHFFDAESAAHLTPEKQDASRRLINRATYATIQFPPGITAQSLRLQRSMGVEANLPIFSEAAKSFGHFDVIPDRDGDIRYAPLLVEYAGEYYPSLPLEVARWYLDPPLPPVIHALGQEGGGGIAAIQLGDRLVPADEEGRLLINYYGPKRAFRYYSLSDVLNGGIEPYKFGDKVVLLGFTSAISQDFYSVPFQNDTYPGVEINATIVANILNDDFLIRPKATILIEAAAILLLGLVMTIGRHDKGPLWSVWAALSAVFGVAALAYAAFVFGKIWINVTYPLLFIVVDYLTITSYKYFTEEKQKRGLKNAFQHYVSPAVVQRMMTEEQDLRLGGERKQLTALFTDIEGFTPISESMPPEELVAFLNNYLSEMTKIVLAYEGTLDKYVGDAIMAFYGAPIDQPDHAARACKTAVDMLVRLKKLQVDWEAAGLPLIQIRIGINSGEMSVGNIGSWERFDYTIMGDNVNLASRLEGVNKYYGTRIIISQATYELCQQSGAVTLIVRELDNIRVKGRREPVTIFELVGYDGLYSQKQALIQAFCEGLTAYKAYNWEAAMRLFEHALALDPKDTPSQMYIERCREFQRTPPPEDWDGVFAMKNK